MEQESWLTLTGVAAMCKVSEMTLRRWLNDPGKMFPPAHEAADARVRRWKRTDVQDWLNQNRPWIKGV